MKCLFILYTNVYQCSFVLHSRISLPEERYYLKLSGVLHSTISLPEERYYLKLSGVLHSTISLPEERYYLKLSGVMCNYYCFSSVSCPMNVRLIFYLWNVQSNRVKFKLCNCLLCIYINLRHLIVTFIDKYYNRKYLCWFLKCIVYSDNIFMKFV